MGTLDAAARRHIEKSKFGIPARNGKPGEYPMPDAEHAANAKGRAETQFKRGNLTAQQKAHIDAMANRILGRGHHS